MIGGNTVAYIKRAVTIQNELGEDLKSYELVQTLNGFIDYSSGLYDYSNKTKAENTSHVFICDFVIPKWNDKEAIAEINGKRYDVLFTDNPMELNDHLEVFLKYESQL